MSREFYKMFHASLTASASLSPTKQRILVWIEFLMGPTPPGPRPTLFSHPAFRRRFPSPAIFGDFRASSLSCMEASRLFLLYRFLSGHDTILNEIAGKVERAITRTLSYAKSKGRPRRLLFRVSNIQKRYNIQHLCFHVALEKKLVSLLVHFITANCNSDHRYCNIAVSTYTTHIHEYTRLFF